jgi:hypothetical protein
MVVSISKRDANSDLQVGSGAVVEFSAQGTFVILAPPFDLE